MIGRTTIKFAAGLFILALLSISAGAMAAGPGGVDTGLAMWLDAQSLGLSNGALVNTWTDLSGLGNNAVSYGWDGYNPEYVTGAINGQAAVRFKTDANPNSQLYNAGGILSGSAAMTAFMVYKDRVPTYGNGLIDIGGTELMDWGGGWACVQDGAWPFTTYMSGPMVPNNVFGLNTVVFNGASSSVKLNGTSLAAAAPNDGTGNVTFDGSQVMRIGARTNTSGVAPVDFAEIIIYNRALSADEESNVGAYLASKYGLSTNYVATDVPEPGTLSILALGVIPFLRRRRK